MSDREPNRDSADRIEELLRATGRRPSVPPDRAERVRATVRAQWRAGVAGRTRRRVAVAAALAGAAAAALALLLLAPWKDEATAWIETVAGTVSSDPSPGERLEPGAELSTGSDGRLALRTASGHSVRLDSDTRIAIVSARELTLVSGAVYVDSGPSDAPRGESLELGTPMGNVRERGTQFETRLRTGALVVRVREGTVLIDRPRRRHEVTAGFELRIAPDGRVSRQKLARSGPSWVWAEAIAPMMEIEGRPLREFLDWVRREKALDLKMGAELAESANETRLSGSIRGMTLEEALDSVLPTCGLTYRIEGATLFVERAERG